MTSFFEHKIIRFVFLILGTIFLLNGILSTVLESLTLGVILTYAVGALLILFSFKAKCLNSRFLVVIKTILLVFISLLLMYSIFVYAYGGSDNVTYEEDAVIVLGTVVIGNQPSADLKYRLDATIQYHKNNPEALIIVTGGQGNDENDTEASVMSTYLKNADINPAIIIMEDRATSTLENFRYSKEILKNTSLENPKVAVISNDFHLFRASTLAKNEGFESITHYHGETPWHMVIPNGLRESIVTIKMWLID